MLYHLCVLFFFVGHVGCIACMEYGLFVVVLLVLLYYDHQVGHTGSSRCIHASPAAAGTRLRAMQRPGRMVRHAAQAARDNEHIAVLISRGGAGISGCGSAGRGPAVCRPAGGGHGNGTSAAWTSSVGVCLLIACVDAAKFAVRACRGWWCVVWPPTSSQAGVFGVDVLCGWMVVARGSDVAAGVTSACEVYGNAVDA